MANEINVQLPGEVGNTLYAIAWEFDAPNGRETGGAWDVLAQVYDDPPTTVGDYDVAITESGSTGRFQGSYPAGFSAPAYWRVYRQAGGSPAWGDVAVAAGVIGLENISTCTTNTDMRGTDSAATAAALATVDTNVDAILVDTAEIGAAGAGLTDLGGMSTAMKAEVNAEADTAISDAGIPAAVWAVVIENSKTAAQIFRGLWSSTGAKFSGLSSGSGTATQRDDADAKNRGTRTIDADGNCTAITWSDLD